MNLIDNENSFLTIRVFNVIPHYERLTFASGFGRFGEFHENTIAESKVTYDQSVSQISSNPTGVYA